MEKLAGIVLMAGLSTRFEGPKNKQLSLLNGKPVFQYSIDVFASRFNNLVVVVNNDNKKVVENYLDSKNYSAKVVLGGATRQESVEHALASLSLDQDDVVVIHDAARPLVDVFIINQVVKAAEENGASTAYLEATDTIAIKNEKEEIKSFVNRSTVAQIQTPQAFKFGVLKKAHEQAYSSLATDDCSLVLANKGTVKLVKGDKKYHKITSLSDLKYLEGLLK